MTLWMIETADFCTCNLTTSELKKGKLNPKYTLLFLLCLTCETCYFVLYREVCCVSAALLVYCLKGNCGLRAGRILAILVLVIVICSLMLVYYDFESIPSLLRWNCPWNWVLRGVLSGACRCCISHLHAGLQFICIHHNLLGLSHNGFSQVCFVSLLYSSP
jgi:hypothetical protein